MAVISSRRCKPSQSVWVPGSPSLLRPRKPPKLATQRMASRRPESHPETRMLDPFSAVSP